MAELLDHDRLQQPQSSQSEPPPLTAHANSAQRVRSIPDTRRIKIELASKHFQDFRPILLHREGTAAPVFPRRSIRGRREKWQCCTLTHAKSGARYRCRPF